MAATPVPRAGGITLPRSRRLLAALDDDRLVAQLRRGNDIAFEVLFDRHHRGVLALCRHMLGSREEAEDAVQHAFAAAYADLVSHDREIHLRAWLYAIARNRCLSMLRARREQAADLEGQLTTDGFADEVQQRDELRRMLADLRELPEEQRSALVLAEVGGLSHAEIAEVLECDVKKVKSLVFQARSGLIERRSARETPCEEIREQLATLRGGSLRRGPLRRHLRACPSCAAYREEVRQQRQMLAVALPVIPSLALRDSVMAAVGLGGGASGAAAGLAAGGAGAAKAGGGVAAVAAKAGVAKLAVVGVIAGGAAVGGGAAIVADGGGDARPRASERAAEARSGAPAPAAPATSESEAAERARERRARERRAERARERRRAAERRRRARQRRLAGEPGEHGRANARGRGRGRQLGLEADRGAQGRERRPTSPPAPRGTPPPAPQPQPQPRQPATPPATPPRATPTPPAEPPASGRGGGRALP